MKSPPPWSWVDTIVAVIVTVGLIAIAWKVAGKHIPDEPCQYAADVSQCQK